MEVEVNGAWTKSQNDPVGQPSRLSLSRSDAIQTRTLHAKSAKDAKELEILDLEITSPNGE